MIETPLVEIPGFEPPVKEKKGRKKRETKPKAPGVKVKAKKSLRFTLNKPLKAKLEATEKEVLEAFGGALPPNYHVVRELSELGAVARSIALYGYMAWDTETSGLDPWRDEIYCITLWVNGEGYLINFEHFDLPKIDKAAVKDVLGPYFSDSTRQYTFNGKFDGHFIEEQLSIPVGTFYFDSYAASWFLDENLQSTKRRLKPLSEEWLGEKTLGTYTDAFGNLAWVLVPPQLAAYYAIKDAELHYKLGIFCEEEMLKFPKLHKNFHEIEMPLYNIFFETEREGLPVLEEELDKLQTTLETRVEELKVEMNTLLSSEDIIPPENWSSNDQVGEIFFNVLKLPVIKKTEKSQKPSLDKDVYEKLQHHHPIVALFAEYKNTEKQAGTFVAGIKDALVDGVLHFSLKTTGAENTRSSSGEPFNMQNVPAKGDRGGAIRGVFTCPDDYYIVSIDFSGQELRIQACLSQDEALIQSALSGTYYSEVAAIAFGGVHTDYTKHGEMGRQRDKAKATVLARNYGGRAKKLSLILGVPLGKTEKFEADFVKKYWKYEKWTEKIKEESHTKWLENFDGRFRRCDYSKFDKQYQIWGLERSAVSYRVSGTAAGQLKRSQVLCYNHIKRKGYKSKLKLPIHDEIKFWIHKDELFNTTIIQEMQYIMENCCSELPIKFETTVEVQKRWGDVIHFENSDPTFDPKLEIIQEATAEFDPSLEIEEEPLDILKEVW